MAKTETPGAIRVKAKAAGFCGRLLEKGDTFMIPSEEAFAPSWMERLDQKQAAATKPDDDTPLRYEAKSNGGGAFIVIDTNDNSRASRRFLKTEGDAKRLAQDEAVRLNAGGGLILDPPTTPPAPDTEPEQEDDPSLPDA